MMEGDVSKRTTGPGDLGKVAIRPSDTIQPKESDSRKGTCN